MRLSGRSLKLYKQILHILWSSTLLDKLTRDGDIVKPTERKRSANIWQGYLNITRKIWKTIQI